MSQIRVYTLDVANIIEYELDKYYNQKIAVVILLIFNNYA
jgi:hypothetical protein